MSSASSAVTYTSVYPDSEPVRVFWGADEELSDGAPQDKDEHEPMFIHPHDPDFVPEPIYHEYIPLEDEHILLAEEQPLPLVVSHTTESPEYVAESDLEKDPEVYEDYETEDGPVDYPMDGGDDGDDDDDNSSGDDADDEDEDEEEEEEHLAPANSAVVIPTNELVSPPEGTEPVISPPSTDTVTAGARIIVRLQAAISLPPEAKVERLLAMPTSSQSPLASLSPPFVGEHLARYTAPTALPSPPLPPPLHMPPPVDRRDDVPETEMPPCKRLCLSTLGSREVGYGIRDTWVDPVEAVPEIAPMTVEEFNTRVTELAKLHEHDTQDLYALLKDAQDSRTRLSHAVHSKLQTHQEQMQQTERVELRETDCRRQAQMAETLRVMGDMRREMGDIQAELLALREQPRRAGQPRGDARFVADETEKIDKYVSGLPDNIYESVNASKPKTLDETIELAYDLMDQKLRTYIERQSNKKRKADDSFRNNHGHQQQTPKRSSGNVNIVNAQRSNGANPKENGCFECGATGHFKRDCPKLKNKDGEKVNAPGWVYAVGNAKKRGNASRDADSNVVM
nr:hypothetical protein [Tanacetum cinerariifolium]